MVSPITRPNPSRTAEIIPVIAEGKITRAQVCQRVAPSEREASLKARGTLFNESSARVKIVGTVIKASRKPAVSEFNLSSAITLTNPPSTAIPKNPINTEGIAEINSMHGLITDCSLADATWFT